MNADGEVFVLDSFALLAYLAEEAGMKRVKQLSEVLASCICR